MKDEYVSYVMEHPELKQIMSDFLSKILLDKPKDIPSYASTYFAGFLPRESKDSVRVKRSISSQVLLYCDFVES